MNIVSLGTASIQLPNSLRHFLVFKLFSILMEVKHFPHEQYTTELVRFLVFRSRKEDTILNQKQNKIPHTKTNIGNIWRWHMNKTQKERRTFFQVAFLKFDVIVSVKTNERGIFHTGWFASSRMENCSAALNGTKCTVIYIIY